MKLGRLLPCHHNICLSHTLHLVVNDAFYVFEKEMEDATANEDSDEKTELHDDSEDDDYEEDDDNCDGKIPSPTNSASTLPSLKSNIDTAVKKIRKIVNKFRRSPVQNDVLQKAVKLKFNKELNLQRDCKTRWSSMVAMLERYLKLEDVVNSVLMSLAFPHLYSAEMNRT